jgi:putative ABC transport system permease protein
MYKSEERLTGVIGGFTSMAIIISALGLFGLASYTAEQRKKEIAVRKVLGSGISEVVALLIKEYFYLVLIANIIAWPVGYYIANKWLQDYAYRISISPAIFILAGVSAIVIMAIAVGYQTIKAATANPANNLRSE